MLCSCRKRDSCCLNVHKGRQSYIIRTNLLRQGAQSYEATSKFYITPYHTVFNDKDNMIRGNALRQIFPFFAGTNFLLCTPPDDSELDLYFNSCYGIELARRYLQLQKWSPNQFCRLLSIYFIIEPHIVTAPDFYVKFCVFLNDQFYKGKGYRSLGILSYTYDLFHYNCIPQLRV